MTPLDERTTLPAYIAERLSHARSLALAERRGGRTIGLSTMEVQHRAAAVAHALRARGVGPGDRVAILAANRLEWLLADYGILYAGAVVVPIFATIAADQIRFILSDSEAKLVFVDDAAAATHVRAVMPDPALQIVPFEAFDAFVAEGTALGRDDTALASYSEGIDPNGLAVLIYTSGTTGQPKGVMLSHRNLISDVLAAADPAKSGLHEGQIALSVLPFAHVMEHMNALGYLTNGLTQYVTTPEHLLADLCEIRPAYVAFVPRIFERIIAAIVGGARQGGGIKAKLVPWAVAVGTEYQRAIRNGGASSQLELQHALAHALVLRKIRPRLGLDRLEYFISGSAPLHRDTALALAAMGLEILEGYGLTETSPVLTVNRPADNTLGTVGRPIDGVELKIADDGEIFARGPNVMLGYYKLPANQQPFTAGGWFPTGDIGRFDAGGRLVITDRKNELFKTSGGKWIAPSRIETAMKRSIAIVQVMVFGANMPHPAALVAPNWDLVRSMLAIGKDVPTREMAVDERVLALVAREAVAHTADLATYEQIRCVAILPRDLTVEDGELSPTLKVKRRVVEQRYASLIATAFAGNLPARVTDRACPRGS